MAGPEHLVLSLSKGEVGFRSSYFDRLSMRNGLVDIADIERKLAVHGLILRGGFRPESEDGVVGGTLVMVGNAGPAMWAAFAAARDRYADHANPLDAWIAETVGAIARDAGGEALFPFGGPPHLPFQRWAQRAEPVHPSPVGVLIHPDYGLWHAYRAALVFAEKLDMPAPDRRPAPCETCADKPCLSACPVGAFDGVAYDVPACVGHITAADSGNCMSRGCAARHACPVGREYAYAPAQAAFHMRAFAAAQRG